MAVNDQRWHQLGDPATDAEAAALATLRDLLPDSALTHAWANVTFRDREGRASEIDVILLHSNGLYLLELKGWHGTITGDQQYWQVTAPNGVRREERDPFLATDGKAKRFASELKSAARSSPGRAPNVVIPFVRAVTVMHGDGSNLDLADASAACTYGLDGYHVSGVRSIRELLDAAPEQYQNVIDAPRARALVALIASLGLQSRPTARMVGQYEVERADPLGEGAGWVDVRAKHPVMAGEHRRIRLYDVPSMPTPDQRKEIERAAHREYALTTKLEHPGVTRALEILESETGPAIVFPDDAAAPSLSEYLARAELDFDTRLSLIRQIGEVLEYAHRHGVQHRALTPAAVHVQQRDGATRVKVRDWQAGRRDTPDSATRTTTLFSGATEVARLVAQDAWLYLAPEANMPNPAGVPLDVYGLGALSYLILADAPPAADMKALQDRLATGGLDPAVDRDGLPADLCDLIRRATTPDLVERIPSVAAFLEQLTAAQKPAEAQVEVVPAADPRSAEAGSVIGERWVVEARLGSGSSGVALLVDDHSYDPPRGGVVLKVAVDDLAADRLRAEAEVLAALDHPRIVTLVDGPGDADGHTAILLEDAGRPTLGRRLADEGRLTLEQLERYGADLFEAVAHLESRKVFHRDIKPDNLGVREARGGSGGDRRRHLVLFDFSLATEPLERIGSGTQGYLDPFLRIDGRHRYDSAAERFAVAATLFEMATGVRPEFGDGASDPALTGAEVHLAPGAFEPEVAEAMMVFFRRALARRVTDRFDDLTSMAQAWGRAFPSAVTSLVPDAPVEQLDARAAAAALSTPLEQAGLSAQAVSAARRLGAHTVAELLDASGFAINNEPGLGVVVRAELQRRRREWAARLRSTSTIQDELVLRLRGVETTQRALLPRSRSRAAAVAPLARRLLNLDISDRASTWPDLATAAAEAGLAGDPAVAAELLVRHWSAATTASDLLADLNEALAAAGGVATVDELAERLVALRGSSSEGAARRRNAIGLVRAAVEGDAGATLAILRHGHEVLVTRADGPAPEQRLDLAVAVAHDIDAALIGVSAPLGPNVGIDLIRRHPLIDDLGIADPTRALSLAARVSSTGALSSRGELYPRGMTAEAAVAAVVGGAPRRISPERLRSLVSSRFHAAQP
ncbi:MAG: NERD domain-containing protein, partial [Candidatus Nanopelagicales bacterium]